MIKEPGPKDPGLRCPKCGCPHLPVDYTRNKLGKIIRKRICRNCGKEMLTKEVPVIDG